MRKVLGKAALRKVTCVRVCSAKASEASIGYEKRSKPIANRWQQQQQQQQQEQEQEQEEERKKKHQNNSKTCKAKPVLTVERSVGRVDPSKLTVEPSTNTIANTSTCSTRQ